MGKSLLFLLHLRHSEEFPTIYLLFIKNVPLRHLKHKFDASQIAQDEYRMIMRCSVGSSGSL